MRRARGDAGPDVVGVLIDTIHGALARREGESREAACQRMLNVKKKVGNCSFARSSKAGEAAQLCKRLDDRINELVTVEGLRGKVTHAHPQPADDDDTDALGVRVRGVVKIAILLQAKLQVQMGGAGLRPVAGRGPPTANGQPTSSASALHPSQAAATRDHLQDIVDRLEPVCQVLDAASAAASSGASACDDGEAAAAVERVASLATREAILWCSGGKGGDTTATATALLPVRLVQARQNHLDATAAPLPPSLPTAFPQVHIDGVWSHADSDSVTAAFLSTIETSMIAWCRAYTRAFVQRCLHKDAARRANAVVDALAPGMERLHKALTPPASTLPAVKKKSASGGASAPSTTASAGKSKDKNVAETNGGGSDDGGGGGSAGSTDPPSAPAGKRKSGGSSGSAPPTAGGRKGSGKKAGAKKASGGGGGNEGKDAAASDAPAPAPTEEAPTTSPLAGDTGRRGSHLRDMTTERVAALRHGVGKLLALLKEGLREAIVSGTERRVKLRYGGEIRVTAASPEQMFDAVLAQWRVFLELPKATPLRVRYHDAEGDVVLIKTTAEYREAWDQYTRSATGGGPQRGSSAKGAGTSSSSSSSKQNPPPSRQGDDKKTMLFDVERGDGKVGQGQQVAAAGKPHAVGGSSSSSSSSSAPRSTAPPPGAPPPPTATTSPKATPVGPRTAGSGGSGANPLRKSGGTAVPTAASAGAGGRDAPHRKSTDVDGGRRPPSSNGGPSGGGGAANAIRRSTDLSREPPAPPPTAAAAVRQQQPQQTKPQQPPPTASAQVPTRQAGSTSATGNAVNAVRRSADLGKGGGGAGAPPPPQQQRQPPSHAPPPSAAPPATGNAGAAALLAAMGRAGGGGKPQAGGGGPRRGSGGGGVPPGAEPVHPQYPHAQYPPELVACYEEEMRKQGYYSGDEEDDVTANDSASNVGIPPELLRCNRPQTDPVAGRHGGGGVDPDKASRWDVPTSLSLRTVASEATVMPRGGGPSAPSKPHPGQPPRRTSANSNSSAGSAGAPRSRHTGMGAGGTGPAYKRPAPGALPGRAPAGSKVVPAGDHPSLVMRGTSF